MNGPFPKKVALCTALAALGVVGVAAIAGVGCQSSVPEPGPGRVERTTTQSQAVTATLPARGFLQVTEPTVGSQNVVGQFVLGPSTTADGGSSFPDGGVLDPDASIQVNDGGSTLTPQAYGTVSLAYEGNGNEQIWVQENSGASYAISGSAFFLNVNVAATAAYRVVCATELPIGALMTGLNGQKVIPFTTTGTGSVVCYWSALNSTSWYSTTVLTGSFAPYVVGVTVDVDNLSSTNMFDVAINEDEFWDPTNAYEIGRTQGFVVQLVTISGSTATIGADTQYSARFMGDSVSLGVQGIPTPSCPSGGCGWLFGIAQLDQPINCGAPPSGMACGPTNTPVAACTPLTTAQACASNDAGAQACAQVTDGCGGLINCNSCPSNQVCGSITPGFCGPPAPSPTPQQVRNAYGDTQNKLCGSFADPIHPGTSVTLAAPAGCTCPSSQICP